MTDVTEAWATIVVAGPASRNVLTRVLGAAWQAALAQLGHMGFADGVYGGHELRLLRASFSGELAFELHCRPGSAPGLWQALVDGGLAPYGLDAVDILRVEKGYLVTSEINGETTPYDLGMEPLVRIGNRCLGRELLDRPAFHEPTRPRLVGLRAADGHAPFLAGRSCWQRVRRHDRAAMSPPPCTAPRWANGWASRWSRARSRKGRSSRRTIRSAVAPPRYGSCRRCTTIRPGRA